MKGLRDGAFPRPCGASSGPAFFGYGSLVNGVTHGYAGLAPARLTGWRRLWRRAPGRRVSLLTVRPAEGAGLDGATAWLPGADWAALDAREAAYRRADCTAQLSPAQAGPVALYAVPGDGPPSGAGDPPILLSYLDAVIAGFARLHGEGAPARFFAETEGWGAPVVDDRAAPVYPRHVPGDGSVTALVDALLVERGARIVRLRADWP